ELTEWSRSFVTTGGISRDDQVNGRWTLEVEDLGAGASGTLRSFSLFVVSRWD
ncbi:MAG: proprotein convertase P-domain-containing protein, partial [Sandaracinaceae bacterium]|nr:proprotein convertase P-domain-containing protein [Sandaracinaceae bacterium]